MTARHRTRSQNNGYQRLFVKKLLGYLPHHSLLSIAHKARLRPAEKFLDRAAKKRIVASEDVCQFGDDEVSKYQKITKNTQLWHGTGRWHHGKDDAIDVLESFCRDSGLTPARDVYAVFGGSDQHVIHSISLCRSRMIARAYADMHGLGWKEKHRYGDALTWTSYYYSLFYARLFMFNGVTMMRRWRRYHALSHDDNGDNTWGKKVNQQARDVWDVFCLGSDIAGNYPILIGVKHLDSHLKLEKPMCQYEVRTDRPIDITNISHIEVPHEKQVEVRQLLLSRGIHLPVTSIELGEYCSAQQQFIELLGLC